MEQYIQHDPNFIGITANGHLSIEPIEDIYVINANYDFLDHGLRRFAHYYNVINGPPLMYTYTKSQIQKLLGEYFSDSLWQLDNDFNVYSLSYLRQYVFMVLYMINNIREQPVEISDDCYIACANDDYPRDPENVVYDGHEYNLDGFRSNYMITRYFNTTNLYILSTIVSIVDFTFDMHIVDDDFEDDNEYIFTDGRSIEIMDRRSYFAKNGISSLVNYNINTYDVTYGDRVYKSVIDDIDNPSFQSRMINTCYIIQDIIKKEYGLSVLSKYHTIRNFAIALEED